MPPMFALILFGASGCVILMASLGYVYVGRFRRERTINGYSYQQTPISESDLSLLETPASTTATIQ